MQEYAHEFAEHIYLNPSHYEKKGGVWCIRMGWNQAKPNYLVGPKSIDYFSLHVVLEGELFFLHNHVREILSRGDIFCLFPHQAYQYGLLHAANPLRMQWVAFQGPQVIELLKAAGIEQGSPLKRNGLSKELEQSLLDLISLCGGNGEREHSDVMKRQAMLYNLLVQLIDKPKYMEEENHHAIPWLKSCLEFIHLHFTEGITVKNIADYAGFHRSYFSDMFTKTVGIPPAQYLQNLRMERAKSMLQANKSSITEIALSLGYPSIYSFSRAFRNFYGVSPSKVC